MFLHIPLFVEHVGARFPFGNVLAFIAHFKHVWARISFLLSMVKHVHPNISHVLARNLLLRMFGHVNLL